MACRVVALLVGLLSGAARAGGAVSGEPPAAVPWADLKDAAVLRVDQVADFGAMVDVLGVLRERSGGRQTVRLLAVGRSEAWFVADILPVGGWAALLGAEPRLAVPAGVFPADEGRHGVRQWTPFAASSGLPAALPTLPGERNP